MARADEDRRSPAFVGRSPELEVISGVLGSARVGHGAALLVTGDAGVGKTRLVAQACSAAGSGVVVLTGACLPMATLSVPLLPLRSAVRALGTSQRPAVLSGTAGGEVGADAALEVDTWLEQLCGSAPVALVIDDLQWADQPTLDVLMLIMAGITQRRLAMVGTVRRGEVNTGHPLQRWLADVRRMAGFAHLELGPLTLTDTHDQIAALVGDEPHDSLVREVFEHTGGNAYLNSLLVQGLPANATGLGSNLPEDLSEAVLRAWHRLSRPGRELARVIAVGGQVARGRRLEIAGSLAEVGDARLALRECTEGGVLEVVGGDGYWFHHPLQAEALEQSIDAAERRRLHAAFAQAYEQDQGATGGQDLETLAFVADHHYLAGHDEEAYRWALRGADRAAATGGDAEQLRLLHRAIELRPRLEAVQEPPAELLERWRKTAETLGELDEELAAVDALLAEIGAEQRPLQAAELLVHRAHLQFATGRAFLREEDMRQAVALAEHAPESWQFALALAELAHAALWADNPEAPELAAEALQRARACGHPRPLSYALSANAMCAIFQDRLLEACALGAEAVAEATAARDGFAFAHATLWEANALECPFSPVWSEAVRPRREELEAIGLPHPFGAWLASDEAGSRLYAGDWDACGQLLRIALGARPGAMVDVKTRLTAARMAALQGRSQEAEGHLARADELFAETSTFLAFDFDATRALVRLSAGDARAAVDAALAGTATPGIPPTMCEWLMPLAARALADLAQAERDAGRSPEILLSEVDDLVQRFPHTIADLGGNTSFYTHMLEGLDALYHAEVARARQSPDAADVWAAAAATLDGVLAWEFCYALWRRAEALLRHGATHRDEAAAVLRQTHALAKGLRALPVLSEVERLATSARIPLVTPVAPTPGRPATGSGLTPRELEILGHIVAGRTYGEIARSLVVSEKTVSSHVSNLLRKTGSANRVDLARWATRADADGLA